MFTEKYIDLHGEEMKEGDHVRFPDDVDGPVGTITKLTDPDADHDGERFIGINPVAYVLWDCEEEDEEFPLSGTAQGPNDDNEWQADELEVIR